MSSLRSACILIIKGDKMNPVRATRFNGDACIRIIKYEFKLLHRRRALTG